MLKILAISAAIIAAIASCEDKSQPQTEGNTNEASASQETSSENGASSMPSDEEIKLFAEQTRLTEDQIRKSYEDCAAQGGTIIRNGFGLPSCMKTTADGGNSCTQNSDCEGFCLAESKTCTTQNPLLGCYEVLIEPEQIASMCVDG